MANRPGEFTQLHVDRSSTYVLTLPFAHIFSDSFFIQVGQHYRSHQALHVPQLNGREYCARGPVCMAVTIEVATRDFSHCVDASGFLRYWHTSVGPFQFFSAVLLPRLSSSFALTARALLN